MKSILVTLLTLFISVGMFAQQDGNKPDRKKLFEEFKAKRVAYITEKVGLTVSESEAFWPIYNELQEKKIDLKKKMWEEWRKMKESKKELTEVDYEKIINANVEIQLQEAQLEKEYLAKFKKILSAEKIYKLQKADKEFIKDTFSKGGGDDRESQRHPKPRK